MAAKFSISQLTLFIFVIVLGIELGAGLYEALVVLPIWISAPPDSVLAYHAHNLANPEFVLNSGRRFWMMSTPLTGLTGIIALLTGLKTAPRHRMWRTIGTVLAVIVVIATFVWFVPNLIKLLSDTVTTLPRDEVTRIATWWVRLNWLRAAVYFVGWIAALKALTIPSVRET